MPLRRSTRAVPAKEAPKAEPKKAAAKAAPKPAARGRSRVAKRRAADDSDTPTPSPPPTKRRRAGSKVTKGIAAQGSLTSDSSKENKTERIEKPAKAAKPVEKKEKKVVKTVQKKPYFNPLPTPPEHTRPAPLLFVWGAGNFGQFGMSEDALGEFEKPTRNKLVEEKMADGAFGGEGAGLEAVAAGGMYSLFIDEIGTVSDLCDLRDTPQADSWRRFGPVERTTTLLSVVTQRTFPTPTSQANSWMSIPLPRSHSPFRLSSTRASAPPALLPATASPPLSARREIFVFGAPSE